MVAATSTSDAAGMDIAQGEPSSSTPPPSPPNEPAPRQLRRRPDQGHIAGVCAGVAEYFRIDPVIVRITAVVLAISGPGVIAYILAWIFVPAAGKASAVSGVGEPERRDRGAQILGIVLLAVAVSVLWGGWWSPVGRWMLPVGLLVLGAWLLLRRDDEAGPLAAAPPTSPPSSPSPPPATFAGSELDTTNVAPSPPPAPTGAPGLDPTVVAPASGSPPAGGDGPPPPPRWDAPVPVGGPEAVAARRRRRMVAPICMGVLLLWTGVATLAGVSMDTGLAVALSIVGVGFVLGAFVGGSKVLIIPAVLVGAALVITSVADIPLSGPIGERTWAPRGAADLADHYELSVGEGTLDLTELDIERGEQIDVSASVGIGHLIIRVPSGVALDISAEAGMGETSLFGEKSSGIGVATEREYDGTTGAGRLRLDLEVGVGQVEVVAGPGDGASHSSRASAAA